MAKRQRVKVQIEYELVYSSVKKRRKKLNAGEKKVVPEPEFIVKIYKQ